MKTFKRIICVVLSLTMCLSSFIVFANAKTAPVDYYTTTGTATYSSIEVSDSILNSAKSKATKMTSEFSYTACIGSAYQVHIYHFKAPSSGYYSFYTTGSLDTVIKVYEEENFLWQNWYEDRGLNDDGGYISSNWMSSNLVLELKNGEDYYVCVRGYNTKVGYYTLNVEGNEDKVLVSRFPSTKFEWQGDNLSTGHILSGVYTISKRYFTPVDCVFFYWALEPVHKNKVADIYKQYCQEPSKGLAAANNVITGVSFATSAVALFVEMSSWVGFVLSCASVLVTVFSYALDGGFSK